jgi:hypothetical protein
VVRKDIKTGDLVLKRKENWENPGKLHKSWEGPYIAKETEMQEVFRLLEQTGEELSYSWNADSLKRYYPWEFQSKIDLFLSISFFSRFTF